MKKKKEKVNLILKEIRIALEKKALDPNYMERVKKSIREDFIVVPYVLKDRPDIHRE